MVKVIPQRDQHASIFFEGGVIVEGTVIEWSNDQIILKSQFNSALTVLTPKAIAAIFYFKLGQKDLAKPSIEIESREAQRTETITKPVKTEEDLRTLAELKQEANMLERNRIAEQLVSHTPAPGAPIKKMTYADPISLLKSQPAKQYPAAQARPQAPRPAQPVRNLQQIPRKPFVK